MHILHVVPYATPQLRQRRRAASQKTGTFAERLGVTTRHYSYVEGGSREGSKTLFLLAAQLLNCEVDELMQSQGAA